MTDILQRREDTPQPVHIEYLQDNWRSAQNIVRFNNELYPWLAGQLEPTHQEIFGESARQNIRSQLTGRVRVNVLPKSNNDPSRPSRHHHCHFSPTTSERSGSGPTTRIQTTHLPNNQIPARRARVAGDA